MTAQEIKQLRLRLGLTQEQFAHKLGVTHNSVNRWEKGKARPSNLAEQALLNLAEAPHSGPIG